MDFFSLDLYLVIMIVFDFDFRIIVNVIFRNYCNLDMYWIVEYVIFE